jgi:hypothetical protein
MGVGRASKEEEGDRYKWVYIKKRNNIKKGGKFKAHLVANGYF